MNHGARGGLAEPMTENRIRVGKATDADRYVSTDHIVWFDEIPDRPAEEQLSSVCGPVLYP